jgi:hypothetical protein
LGKSAWRQRTTLFISVIQYQQFAKTAAVVRDDDDVEFADFVRIVLAAKGLKLLIY